VLGPGFGWNYRLIHFSAQSRLQSIPRAREVNFTRIEGCVRIKKPPVPGWKIVRCQALCGQACRGPCRRGGKVADKTGCIQLKCQEFDSLRARHFNWFRSAAGGFRQRFLPAPVRIAAHLRGRSTRPLRNHSVREGKSCKPSCERHLHLARLDTLYSVVWTAPCCIGNESVVYSRAP